MKLMAAWRSTRVTRIRANDLWTGPGLGGESPKNKFDRLFSDLLRRAQAPTPEATREARAGAAQIIVIRQGESLLHLLGLLNTWADSHRDDEKLRESGAYDPVSGVLFRDLDRTMPAPEAGRIAQQAYLRLLDTLIVEMFNAARNEYEQAVAEGRVIEGFVLHAWKAEQAIARRFDVLRNRALFWTDFRVAEVMVLRPQAEYERLVRARVGQVFEDFESWVRAEQDYFQVAITQVDSLAQRVHAGGDPGEPAEILRRATELLRAHPVEYREGQRLRLLAMSREEVDEVLDSLDSILLQISGNSALLSQFHSTYRAFHSYYVLRHATDVIAPLEEPFTRHVRLTPVTIREMEMELRARWERFPWMETERLAADQGRVAEFRELQAASLLDLERKLAEVADDPWSGPLGRDPQGRVVPFAGIGIGRALYSDWIATLVDEAAREVKDSIALWEPHGPAEYVASETYLNGLLAQYARRWDTIDQGVGLLPAFLDNSVKGPAWRTFTEYVLSKTDRSFWSIASLERAVQAEYVRAVLAVRDRAASLLRSGALEYPDRLIEIEAIAKNLLAGAYTRLDVANLLAEARLLHLRVPWDAAYQRRFDETYRLLDEYLAGRGEMPAVGREFETHAYHVHVSTVFQRETENDKLVAEWIGMDYSAALRSWKEVVWRGLNEVERRIDLTEREYSIAQAGVVREADHEYRQWRTSLLDTARARLVSLAARLRNRTASAEDRQLAMEGAALTHIFLDAEIRELKTALEQTVESALLASLNPFSVFDPMKSVAGFDVEEFTPKRLALFFENWAEPRLGEGLFVEPKFHGYRIILHSDGKDSRIYLEEGKQDFSNIYKNVAKEVKKLPPVILDGELIELVEDKPTALPGLGKFRRSAVDDTHAIVYVFDILYLNEPLHNKPYRERRKILDQFFSQREFKHLRKAPAWEVSNKEDLEKRLAEAEAHLASEGSMIKTSDSKYLLDRRTSQWAKIRETHTLHVRVLGRTTTKKDDFVYRCGVKVKDPTGIDPSELEEKGGSQYVVLGTTFRTTLKVKEGSVLEVIISEITEQEGAKGKKFHWMLPKVQNEAKRKPDSLEYARKVGRHLSASIDRPWQFITAIMTEAMTATSVPQLRSLKAKLLNVLADLNYERVVRFAWNVVELIRERLGQAVDPLITERGVEKIYEIGTIPRVTEGMVGEINSQFEALAENIEMTPPEKSARGRELLTMLRGFERLAEGIILFDIRQLSLTIAHFVSLMKESGDRTVIEIDRELGALERALSDLIQRDPPTLADEAEKLQRELAAFIEAIGDHRDLFVLRLDALALRIETLELPMHSTIDTRNWLGEIRERISQALSDLLEERPLARFALETSIPMELDNRWRELTETQQALFKVDFERLRAILERIEEPAGVGGALFWASSAPLKLDLGCGKNKEPGHKGIDIKLLSGVDKLWDLEKGIPYPDSSVCEVRAHHVLEHLSEPQKIMEEIWRVLLNGGLLHFEVPSAKREGADTNPDHKSRWTKLSFPFYTDDALRKENNLRCKFDLISLEEETKGSEVYVRGTLRACKPLLRAAEEPNIAEWLAAAWIEWEGRTGLKHSDFPEFVQDIEWRIRRELSASPTEEEVSRLMRGMTEFYSPVSPHTGQKWTGPSFSPEDVEAWLAHVIPRIQWQEVRRGFTYGAHEFLTVEDLVERGQKIEEWLNETDFAPVAQRVLEEGGTWRSFQLIVMEMAAAHILPFDRQLETRARGRKPEDYPWAIEPREWDAPPGAGPEWALEMGMKSSLGRDPFVQEIAGIGEGGLDPFHQAISKTVSGLVIVGAKGTDDEEGAHGGFCGGYFAGIDEEGYPLFVTAAHCTTQGGTAITLANGVQIMGDIVTTLGDSAVLRGRQQIENQQPLSLGVAEGGWSLGLSPLFREAELIQHRPGFEFDPTIPVTRGCPTDRVAYGMVNLGRSGWSGSPVVNSRGQVIGIASIGLGRYDSYYDTGPKWKIGYAPLSDLIELYRRAGLPRPQGLGGAALTKEGESPGNARLDFMASKPKKIPVKGILWTHIRGINPENKNLSLKELLALPLDQDSLNIHHDLRFDWGDKLEGISIFIGNQNDYGKLLEYEGGKLGVALKMPQPPIWNEPKELHGRVFAPGTVGNAAGKLTWGRMFKVAEVTMIPSRLRSSPKGERYWEWDLTFKGHPVLNGLWGLSEGAAAKYDLPFMFWRLEDQTPFWQREQKGREKEIEAMPDWQKSADGGRANN